jgi:formate hydrogenlyase subunit 3/multisubunit Na+/H+ antiporter MnhD subunit
MSQPFPPPPATTAATVPNNMIMAIIAIVVSVMGCCLPHGLVSLMYAMQVGKKEAAGDLDGARNAAKQAKMWAWISIIVGALSLVLCLVFGVFAGIMSAVSR